MNGPIESLLTETGKQLAQRFTNALTLPGLLFIAVLAVADRLGQRHSIDAGRLLRATEDLIVRYDGRPVVAVLALVAAVLAGASAGVVCAGLASMLGSVWLAQRPAWLIRPLVQRRVARWRAAHNAFQAADAATDRHDAADRERLAALAAARNAIALTPPTRATWIADRLGAASVRVWAEYGLDVSFSWSRLWLVLPDEGREELRIAGRAYAAARALQAWGVLYILVGLIWWPAAVGGAVAAVLGWRRGRTAAATLADLIESSYDLHVRTLIATINGEPTPGPLDPLTGERLNLKLRKGA